MFFRWTVATLSPPLTVEALDEQRIFLSIDESSPVIIITAPFVGPEATAWEIPTWLPPGNYHVEVRSAYEFQNGLKYSEGVAEADFTVPGTVIVPSELPTDQTVPGPSGGQITEM